MNSEELNSVEEARCVGVDFAAEHAGVDVEEAKEFAARWYKTSEPFPDQKAGVTATALKSRMEKAFLVHKDA
jgi:hypothetical protein